MMRRFIHVVALATSVLLCIACSEGQTYGPVAGEPKQTTKVAGPSSGSVATSTSLPASSFQDSTIAEPTLFPSPTPVTIVVLPGGGDVQVMQGTIVTYLHILPVRDQPAPPRELFPRKLVFVEQLSLQIRANVPSVGSWDGAGIERVEMEVFDEDDTLIYAATDNEARFCLFGGDASLCNVERIAPHHTWPKTSTLYRNGHYVARFTVFPDDEAFRRRSWSQEFEIRMPE